MGLHPLVIFLVVSYLIQRYVYTHVDSFMKKVVQTSVVVLL